MILPLVYYPSPILRQPKLEKIPPTTITPQTRRLVANMRDTMFAEEAAGIAAPQVGSLERIFLIDGYVATGVRAAPAQVFINPKILSTAGSALDKEGCLSLPSVLLEVRRPKSVVVTATNLDGEEFTVEASGLYARAIQHEFDHLEGKLMIDLVSLLQRDAAQRAVQRWKQARGL